MTTDSIRRSSRRKKLSSTALESLQDEESYADNNFNGLLLSDPITSCHNVNDLHASYLDEKIQKTIEIHEKLNTLLGELEDEQKSESKPGLLANPTKNSAGSLPKTQNPAPKKPQIKLNKVQKSTHRVTPKGLPKKAKNTRNKFTVEEIYLNKDYKSPLPKALETIYENDHPSFHKILKKHNQAITFDFSSKNIKTPEIQDLRVLKEDGKVGAGRGRNTRQRSEKSRSQFTSFYSRLPRQISPTRNISPTKISSKNMLNSTTVNLVPITKNPSSPVKKLDFPEDKTCFTLPLPPSREVSPTRTFKFKSPLSPKSCSSLTSSASSGYCSQTSQESTDSASSTSSSNLSKPIRRKLIVSPPGSASNSNGRNSPVDVLNTPPRKVPKYSILPNQIPINTTLSIVPLGQKRHRALYFETDPALRKSRRKKKR